MGLMISGANVCAWVETLDALVTGDGEAVNLMVAIADPTTEEPAVRTVIDAFIDERRRASRSVKRISTVANTIFPESWYLERRGLTPKSTSTSWSAPAARFCGGTVTTAEEPTSSAL